jgi:signal transduction histidine kinase/CheY-like chemotaxis protein
MRPDLSFHWLTLAFVDENVETSFIRKSFPETFWPTMYFTACCLLAGLIYVNILEDQSRVWVYFICGRLFVYSILRIGIRYFVKDPASGWILFCRFETGMLVASLVGVMKLQAAGELGAISVNGLMLRMLIFFAAVLMGHLIYFPSTLRAPRTLLLAAMPFVFEYELPLHKPTAMQMLSLVIVMGELLGYVLQRAFRVSYQERTSAVAKERELLAHIFHEVRNPLNGIMGHLRLAQSSHDAQASQSTTSTDGDDNVSSDIQSALVCTEQAVRFLNQLMQLEKLDAGLLDKAKPLPNVSLSELLQRVHTITSVAVEAGMELRVDISDALRTGFVTVDSGLVEGILINLVQNAARFTKQGHITIICHLLCSDPLHAARPAGETIAEVLMGVRDTGSGMAPEAIQTLFNRFMHTLGGHGLGLHLVQKQLGLMGSSLRVRSPWAADGSPGSEFLFTLKLPLSSGGSDEPVLDTQSLRISPGTLRVLNGTAARAALPHGIRCLVADDVGVNRILMKRALEKFCGIDWVATTVDTAERAIELACAPAGPDGDGRPPFDLIVMDENFAPASAKGSMRGSEAIRVIAQHAARKGGRRPAMVLCTGNTAAARQASGDDGTEPPEGCDLMWDKPCPDPTDGSMANELIALLGGVGPHSTVGRTVGGRSE